MTVREESTKIAFHEVGHAVMAMANRFNVAEISLIQDGSTLGYVRYQMPEQPETEDYMRSILVLASGAAADFVHWKHSGGLDASEVVCGDMGDRMDAQKYLDIIGYPMGYEAFLGNATAYLQRDDVWPIVDQLAHLLLQCSRINGVELLKRVSRSVPEFGEFDFQVLERSLQRMEEGEWSSS